MLFILALVSIMRLTSGARVYHGQNKSDLYDHFPMYQDTTQFYNLFLTRNSDEKEEQKETESTRATTSTTTLSPNDVNFPNDPTPEKEAKYIKISSSIEIPETESVKLVLDALKVLWDASLTSMWKGFMPSMERVRRDTSAFESTKGTD